MIVEEFLFFTKSAKWLKEVLIARYRFERAFQRRSKAAHMCVNIKSIDGVREKAVEAWDYEFNLADGEVQYYREYLNDLYKEAARL